MIAETEDSPFAVDAVRRIENWEELGNFEEKVIMLDPWLKEYEYLGDPKTRLDESDQRFQMHVHARPAECVYGEADYSFDFDGVIDFDYEEMGTEEFLEEYRVWVNVFEEEFPDADLYYPDPEEYL